VDFKKIEMMFRKITWVISLLIIILTLQTADSAVVNVYANFDHLKNPFTQWYHGGHAEIVEVDGNKILSVDGGTAGRVIGSDIQNSPYVKVKFNVKMLNTTNGYLRVVVYKYPMSSEGYKEEREICGIYLTKNKIISFNKSKKEITNLNDGWNTITLNIDMMDGVASVEYNNEKHIFNIPAFETRRYFIFRVDPGTQAYIDEVDLKAGFDYYELFDAYTFERTTPTPEVTTPSTKPTTFYTTPTTLLPRFSDLKILLDKNYELLYQTEYYGHKFYIVKYYNYIPSGTGVEIVTESGLKIGGDDKDYAKAIIDTLSISKIEKDLLYRSWEERQNGITTVYLTIIGFLLFLLAAIAIIIWKA
jgi:hypothetical protein